MKMILSSCDFLNPNSKQVILDNLDKKLCECKVLFIPNQKATYEKIHSDKYYDRLIECGFGKRENIYIFDESESEKFKNLNIDIIYISGGNTFATLNKIRKANFDNEIKKYIKKGVIYIGGSCGAHIVTKNIEHLLKLEDNYINIMDFNALGLFDGVIVPHCEANEYTPELREKIYSELLKEGKYNVYKLTNDESLIVTEEKIIKKI